MTDWLARARAKNKGSPKQSAAVAAVSKTTATPREKAGTVARVATVAVAKATEAKLCRRIETACQGLTITPAQLRTELQQGGDIPDVVSGALTPRALRMIAETLALMRYALPPEPDA
ncbi:MAG: hypothetical protein ACREVE_10525 [Gammaproteobacteria bacterium]